jgi:hypothetical protein
MLVAILPPHFSVSGGFYSTSFNLTLTTDSTNEIIYYTLDGSEPTKNSVRYKQNIFISRTTVVRARSLKFDSLQSRVETHTYFINNTSTLPVISISTDPANLWDNDYGIYVLGDSAEPADPHYGANYWQDWEKPIHIEMFETVGTEAFSMDAGVKIYGSWMRMLPQKSLAIFARKIYGTGKIKYKVFPDLPLDKFESIVLRNSGNDWNYTMFRDAMMHTLAKNTGIDILAYRPAVVYLNGEYWGVHNIREKINEHYIANHYDVNPDSVDLLEYDGDIITGDNAKYKELIKYINSYNLSINSNYDHIKTLMDVDEYISYMVSEIYFDNTDWPGNNIKFWRSQSQSGKWRWIMYDTDFGFGLYRQNGFQNNSLEAATATNGPDWPNPPWSTLLLRKLLNNTDFKNSFINRYADYANSIFNADTVIKTIQKLKSIIEPEMPAHIQKWGSFTILNWNENVRQLEEFANKRNAFMNSHFVQKFKLSGISDITLNTSPSNAGKIILNTLSVNKYPWKGTYFQNIPIKITAIPNTGYKFKEWNGMEDTNSSITYLPLISNISVSAVFEPDSSNLSVLINEINYNSAEDFDTEDWVELYNKGNTKVDITGWSIKDDNASHSFQIPTNTLLNKESYLVICQDTLKFPEYFPDVVNKIGNLSFGLNNGGEKISLYDKNINIVDSLTFSDNIPWPEDADGKGKTLSLINPNLDNSVPQNWLASLSNGTPGKPNDTFTNIDKKENPIHIKEFVLEQNFPNPFNPSTVIGWQLPVQSYITLKVYDVLGREIVTLVNEEKSSGIHKIEYDASNLSGGIYFYRLEASVGSQCKKMLLIK